MRALLLWLLMLALPVYGASSTSLRVLGPAHWHTAPAVAAPAADDWLQPALQVVQRVMARIQELRIQTHAREHALGRHHEHANLLRHWHDAADGSVHAVGSADPAVADLVAGAAVGGATLTMGTPVLPLFVAIPAVNGRWPAARSSAWADADPQHSPPPPRG